jgi:hypothetical protein
MNRLRPQENTGVRGSNPTRGMDVCVRLFSVFVVLCVGSVLATGVPQTVFKKLKNGQGPTGCRATEREKNVGRMKGEDNDYRVGKTEASVDCFRAIIWNL